MRKSYVFGIVSMVGVMSKASLQDNRPLYFSPSAMSCSSNHRTIALGSVVARVLLSNTLLVIYTAKYSI